MANDLIKRRTFIKIIAAMTPETTAMLTKEYYKLRKFSGLRDHRKVVYRVD
jgi:hypothetical protein